MILAICRLSSQGKSTSRNDLGTLQVTQGKGTTAGDLSTSLKKSDSPAAKKKTAVNEAGDAASGMAGTAKQKPALGSGPEASGGPKIYTCYM